MWGCRQSLYNTLHSPALHPQRWQLPCQSPCPPSSPPGRDCGTGWRVAMTRFRGTRLSVTDVVSAAVVCATVAVGVYINSLRGRMVFDDLPAIVYVVVCGPVVVVARCSMLSLLCRCPAVVSYLFWLMVLLLCTVVCTVSSWCKNASVYVSLCVCDQCALRRAITHTSNRTRAHTHTHLHERLTPTLASLCPHPCVHTRNLCVHAHRTSLVCCIGMTTTSRW